MRQHISGSRRRMSLLLVGTLLAGCLSGCALFPGQEKQTDTFLDVFDTVSTVTAYGMDKEAFVQDEQRLHALLTEYHHLYDIYNSYDGLNNLKTVNDRAGGEPVPVDGRIIDLLEFGLTAYEQTSGRVNIVFGAVLSLWHDSREAALRDPDNAMPPAETRLRAAAAHVSPACLEIDRAAGTVRLTDRAARLDVGALAKGYATEQATRYAQNSLGWTSALLSIGGNVRAIGQKSSDAFTVGIQNPDTESAVGYLMTVGISDAAVVTSGDYQRYFTAGGQRYAHIIDPDTLFPPAYMHAVSVIHPDSGIADLLSTALFTMPVDDGLSLLKHYPDAQAVFILPDGKIQMSDGFSAYKN